jgi:hypothetical protein
MVAAAANQITLTHADDTIVDGSQNWTATTAAATGALTYDTSDIFATTTDNENYYYVKVTGNTKEADAATTATIDVCLGANNPDLAITLNIACTVAGDECGTLSAASITFPINSQVALANASNAGCSADGNKQSFTVEGFDDTYADGTQTFTITLSKVATADTGYASAPNSLVTPSISNLDNEAPGKAIFVSTSSYNGEFTSTGVKNTDSICNSTKPGFAPSGTYKAMMVSSSSGEVTNDRVAGVTDWVLTAGNYYYRCESGSCTDQVGHLFVADGASKFDPLSMSRDFSTTLADEFWTGMTTTLNAATQPSTPAGTCVDASTVYRHNCHGFTYQNCPTNGAVFFYGQIWKNNGGGTVTSSESICSASKKILCVQQ